MPDEATCDDLLLRVKELEEKLLLFKGIEEERHVTAMLLGRIATEKDLQKLMSTATSLLRSWSGCSAVGVRLRDGDDFPYFETRGFPEEFIRAENSLCAVDENKKPVRDSLDRPVLECMCGNVLLGRFDPSNPFFTKGGSFWTNSTTEFLAKTADSDGQTRTRNQCNAAGFESIALVPLRMGGETFGLLQFNDKKKGRFTKERIVLLENLATNLATALAHRKAVSEAKGNKEEITKTSKELSLGLSEVFTALREIASGNPTVRISETSELELVAKLKQLVNMTAEDLGEIVDLSHEFAMGLAEHFDVLHRVSQGDLSARVVGTSPVELLEYLKKETNKTIQSVSREMKERIKAEKEKRELEAQVFHSQKMEALGILAGGIVHDFNNMLMIIRAEATLMLHSTDLATTHREKIESIQEQVKKGGRLVEQLLGFAKVRKLEIEPTDLNTVLDKTADLFAGSRPTITIHRKYEKDLWLAQADKDQIEQVLLNLFFNAADAMPEGGKLYLETQNAVLNKEKLGLHNLIEGNYVKISTKDTGVGMDQETRQRIFEPFFTTKGQSHGTGLGLSSAYGIIKNHLGLIDVESIPRKGTTVHVYLPAYD
jgi:signal transduction histidine kinase